MKITAINGSPRKGKSVDRLIDKAIEGLLAVKPETEVVKIHLIDKDLRFAETV